MGWTEKQYNEENSAEFLFTRANAINRKNKN